VTQPSQRAAYVLMEVGIQPWKAGEKEIELAEQAVKEYRYIESAADHVRKVLDVQRG
jgi:hypothetical protein